MKVTFCAFDAESYVAGPNSWLQRLLPRLRQRGADPRVLCVSANAQGGPMVRALRRESIDVVVLPWPAPTRRTVRRILDDLAHRPPDVFVPNLLVAGFIAGRTVRDAGIATVGVLHSDDDFHRAVFHRFVTGPKAFRLSAVVCVSRYLEARVAEGVPAGTVVRRIPYGVPVPETHATPPGDELTLAYVGRLVEAQKRVVATARSFCRAVREVERTRAVIYGDGPARPLVEEVLR
ncbi:MAG: glycosyltransferase, partial [Acidobacteria bacterium]|nr:glycosyltransferase [Acidobacteriota bacterium]